VPRPKGLIVGATTEAGIWDEDFNLNGQTYLESHLKKFFPQVVCTPLETWVGIRPRTQDRLPWMGFLNEQKSISICAGHYKSGMGMAPLSALCMSNLINGEKTLLNLDAFSPWRKKGLKKMEC
jgi:glycine oxidase